MTAQPWKELIDDFWQAATGKENAVLRAELEKILTSEMPAGHVAFERASLHDYLGEEIQAIPLYRQALGDTSLSSPQRSEAIIQLASSLRNVGEPEQALAVLSGIGLDDPLHSDAQAFQALALFDSGQASEALATALTALAPALRLYSRPVRSYAQALGGDEPPVNR